MNAFIPCFDPETKCFKSVGVTAVQAAELRLKLRVVATSNIAQGFAPARYISSPGTPIRAIYVSTGLQIGNVVSEYLVWREIARALDDGAGGPSADAGRWSRHIPDCELATGNLCVQHECAASLLRVNHRIHAKHFGEVEFDESRLVPEDARHAVALSLRSRRDRWCSGFADALACPTQCEKAAPKLFMLVKFALQIDLGLELLPA